MRLNLSQEEAAERVGLPLVTYQVLEAQHSARTNPSLLTVLALAQHLEISVAELLSPPTPAELSMEFPLRKRARRRKNDPAI
jgi:transcriptional regulator with XRE-family HTH domain